MNRGLLSVWSLPVSLVLAIVGVTVYYALFQSDQLNQKYSNRLQSFMRIIQTLEKTESTIVLRDVIYQNPQLGLRLYESNEPVLGSSCVVVTSHYQKDGVPVEKGTPLLILFIRKSGDDYSVLVLSRGYESGGICSFGFVSKENVKRLPTITDHPVVKKWLKHNNNLNLVMDRYRDWP